MPEFVLRVEGVNFDATFDDTNDLSTIRGSSLAHLRADKLVCAALAAGGHGSATKIFAGASQCAFVIEATDEPAAQKVAEAVRTRLRGNGTGDELGRAASHLCFVVDVAPAATGSSGIDALELATARNRTRQYREWTLPLPPFSAGARDHDPFDSVRPATAKPTAIPDGKFLLPVAAPAPTSSLLFAPSVLDRRHYGRTQRQQFYRDEAGARLGSGLAYADEFEAMVASAPAVPDSLRNKIAVLYADGNGFGGIRDNLTGDFGGSGRDALGTFASQLGEHRRELLTAVCKWYRDGLRHSTASFDLFAVRNDRTREDRYDLRLETLLWGGDELIFVMPSWLAFAALDGFFKVTAGRTITGPNSESYPLTHAVGLVVCHHKTPIRQARRVAKDLADHGKKSGAHDSATVAVFESLSPSESDVAEARRGAYGARDETAADLLDSYLTLPGAGIGKLMALVEELREAPDPILPRSKLYDAIRKGRHNGGLMTPEADAAIKALLDDYARRVHNATSFDGTPLALPSMPGLARPLPVTLGLLAELWDYAAPFARGTLPPFAVTGAKS